MSELTATFWGVRGGLPVPGEKTIEFGGNTTCLEVWAGPHLIIVDAGTGIIGLGAKLAAQRAQDHKPIVGTLLFTHGHHDHTQGLSFFNPLRFRDTVFHVFGPRVFGEDLQNVLRRAILPSVASFAVNRLPGMRSIRIVQDNEMIVLTQRDLPPTVQDLGLGGGHAPPGAVKIHVYHSSRHPRGGSLTYSIEYRGKRLVFATDTEGYEDGDRCLTRFVRDADLLVHDAEYTDTEYAGPPLHHQGWGHSTWRMAIKVGKAAKVKRLALTHHNARHDDATMRDMEKEAQAAFPEAFFVREGTTIEL